MTIILDGKLTRDKYLANLKKKIDVLQVKPVLAVILVGDNPASRIYVNNKKKTAEKLGIISKVYEYPDSVDEETLICKIEELNSDRATNAILVQLPLPAHINKQNVINAISPEKDVDCFTVVNSGFLELGVNSGILPCTPKGILLLLDEYGISLKGKRVVVVGRSNLVGKPMSLMMLYRDATVTICHSKTENLGSITRGADIIVSAAGYPIINSTMVREGAVVIDVGIFRDENGKLRGDVDYDSVAPLTSYISPVPGGVGPMTITALMLNTYELYLLQNKKHR